MSRLSRRLKRIGSQVIVNYACEINNDKPLVFETQDDMLSYLDSYRSQNVIFNLKCSRIEIYSL